MGRTHVTGHIRFGYQAEQVITVLCQHGIAVLAAARLGLHGIEALIIGLEGLCPSPLSVRYDICDLHPVSFGLIEPVRKTVILYSQLDKALVAYPDYYAVEGAGYLLAFSAHHLIFKIYGIIECAVETVMLAYVYSYELDRITVA